MGVDSYLELFTTLYGWEFSSIIMSVLASTGILYLPFLVILIEVWLEAHQRGQSEDTAPWMIRTMEVKLGCAIFVLAMCVSTTSVTSLTSAHLMYTPTATAVDPSPTTVTGANSNTTYANPEAFGASLPGGAEVPPWWFTVMALSSGINGAVKAGVNGGIQDFRQIQDIAQIASIQDPRLRSGIQRFYSECFVPARSLYLKQGTPSSTVTADLTQYGQADVDWIGSHAFQDDPMYYQTLRTSDVVAGFPYDPGRDVEVDPNGALPSLGMPTCVQWWQGQNGPGLRDAMVNAVGGQNGLYTAVQRVFMNMSVDDIKDKLARTALTKSLPSYISPENIIGDDRSTLDKVIHAASDDLGVIGAGYEAFKASATMMPLITLITMAQPMVLMAMYMFLPLIMVFSRYSLSTMMVGGLAIFTVKFWSVMWFIARFMDDHLIAAMYPGANGNVLLEAITTGLDGSYKRMILNILLMMMYVGLPLLWSGMMAWVGVNVRMGVEGILKSASETAGRAGEAGADAAINAAKKAM